MARPDYRIVRLKWASADELSRALMGEIDRLNATSHPPMPRDWCVHSFSAADDELVFLLKNTGADGR